jgi:hypothetical protein
MATLKTTQSDKSVDGFLETISDAERRQDCFTLVKLMKQVTKAEPKMWGTSIVGFGNYHYKYQSGREGDWFLTGFSPRKQNLTIYLMSGVKRYARLLKRLGKFKTAGSCLYIKRLEDISIPTLKELIKESVSHLRKSQK